MKNKNTLLEKAVVKDNTALIDPNTLISITEVKPINLSELEPDEKLNLIFQYQYFLRSLTFPIQIVLRFVNKDCEKFLYRKRMANVEETIKTVYNKYFQKINPKNDDNRRKINSTDAGRNFCAYPVKDRLSRIMYESDDGIIRVRIYPGKYRPCNNGNRACA